MSSHHIIREKQEPALLVLGLDTFPSELLGQLLEWSPTIIATKQTAGLLIDQGIKVDCIISEKKFKLPQSDIKHIPSGSEPLPEAALKYLVTHNYPAVNVIADELQLKDYLFFADKISLVIFHGNQKIYAINTGYSKWKPAGDVIEVLTHPHELHVDGLESIGSHSFKTTHDGFFSLRFDHPFLFIAEAL